MSISAWLMGLLFSCQSRPPGAAPLDMASDEIRLVGIANDSSAVVMRLSVRAGSVHEVPGRHGVSALAAKQLAEQANVSVDIGQEMIHFEVRSELSEVCSRSESFSKLFPLQINGTPRFEDIKAAVKKRLLEQPLSDIFNAFLFEARPYGQYAFGRTGSLPSINPLEIRQFVENRYVRGAAVMGVFGPVVNEKGGLDDSQASKCIRNARATLTKSLPPQLHRNATPRGIEFPDKTDVLLLDSVHVHPHLFVGRAVNESMGHSNWAASLVGLSLMMERLRKYDWGLPKVSDDPFRGDSTELTSGQEDGKLTHEHQEIPFQIHSPTFSHLGMERVQSDLTIRITGFSASNVAAVFDSLFSQLSRQKPATHEEVNRAQAQLSKRFRDGLLSNALKWKNAGVLLGYSHRDLLQDIADTTLDQVNEAVQIWGQSGLKVMLAVESAESFLPQLISDDNDRFGSVFKQSHIVAIQ